MMKPDALQRALYMIANEAGKGRGKKDGGVRDIKRWKSVCSTTTEISILNGKEFGGAEVRTIQTEGGIGANIPEIVNEYNKKSSENYGVIGRLFIKKIFEDEKDLKEIYTTSENRIKEELKGVKDGSGTTTRLISTYAVIATAGYIFEDIMNDLGHPMKDPLKIVISMLNQKLNNSVGGLAERAINVLMDWKATNFKHINQDGNPYDPKYIFDVYGNINTDLMIGEEYLDIIPTVLETLLDKHFDKPGISKAILKEWGISGILEISKDGRKTIQSTIKKGQGQTRIYRINLKSIGGGY